MTASLALSRVRTFAKRQSTAGLAPAESIGDWAPDLPAPHPGQQSILNEAARYNVVCCGRRWGKTVMGLRLLLSPATQQGLPVAWFAPDYKALTEVWREVCRAVKAITLRTDSQQHRLELKGGGVIEFWSLDSDPEACRGRKYARAVLDEAAKARHLEIAWEQAIRPTLIDYRGDAWFLSTPRGKGDFFHTLYQRGIDAVANWRSWHAPTSTNPTIANLEEELAVARADTPDAVYRQEFEAEFIDAGGLYFDEWKEYWGGEEWHACTPFDIPAHWPKWGGLDYGKAAPFAFMLLTSSEGERGGSDWDVYLIDEEYQERLTPSQQAEKVLACLNRNSIDPAKFTIFADPSIFPPSDPKERVGEYPVEAFWKAGLRVVRAVNSRVPGWTFCMEWLHFTRKEKGVTVPRFRAFKGRCVNFIRTIPLMIRDSRPGHIEDLDTKLEDHAADAWRYGMMSRFRPSKEAQEAPPPPLTGWQLDLAKEHNILNPGATRV